MAAPLIEQRWRRQQHIPDSARASQEQLRGAHPAPHKSTVRGHLPVLRAQGTLAPSLATGWSLKAALFQLWTARRPRSLFSCPPQAQGQEQGTLIPHDL